REVYDRQSAMFGDLADQFVRGTNLLGKRHPFFSRQDGQTTNLAENCAGVTDGLDDIAGAGLALGADHGRALSDAPERYTEIARAAYKRNSELALVDMELLVGGREDFALVYAIDSERL